MNGDDATQEAAPRGRPNREEPRGRPRREDRYVAQHPTVHAIPTRSPLDDPHCCGNCPGWQANPRAPFGQCLPAIKWLGAPMYTPELSGCTMDPAEKAKGATR